MIAVALTAVLASAPIGLDEARQLAREQNSAAVLADLTYASSIAGVRLAKAVIYPQLSLIGSANGSVYGPQQAYEPVPQVDANGNVTGVALQVATVPTNSQSSFNAALNIAQLIYDGGKWWNTISQAGELQRAAEHQLTEQRNASEFEGVRRFYELLRAEKSVQVLQATVRRSREQLERAGSLFEAGRALKGDVYTAQVNLGNDEISVVRQNGAVANAQADLAIWIGRPGADVLTARDPGTLDPAPTRGPALDGSLEAARQNRPLLRALADQVRAGELGVLVARSTYLPKVSALAALGRQGPSLDPTFTDPRRQNYLTAGLQVRWDFFSGFATDAQVEQARVQKVQAEVNLAEAVREVEGDVRKTLATLDFSVDVWGLAVRNRESASQALALAAERYKAGAGSQLEIQDAQLKLTQSELALLSSRIDVEIAKANVSRVLGTTSPGATQ